MNEIEIYDSNDPELAKYRLKITEGELSDDTKDAYPILVSKKYAEKNNVVVGDSLDLDFGSGYDEEQETSLKKRESSPAFTN